MVSMKIGLLKHLGETTEVGEMMYVEERPHGLEKGALGYRKMRI